MSEVRDFDAFWAEKEAEDKAPKLSVRFEEREYLVPASPSAPVVLRRARLLKSGVESISDTELLDFAEGMLGRENLSAIMDANPALDMPKFAKFLSWVSDLQTGTVPNPTTGRAKRRKRSTSSRAGTSSSRTSSASTASTFASS